MKEQVCEFRALLYKIQLRHTRRFFLELFNWNAEEFGEDQARVVEAQGLVEVAGEQILLNDVFTHITYYDRPRGDGDGELAVKRLSNDSMRCMALCDSHLSSVFMVVYSG
jgi:hypothetical protein